LLRETGVVLTFLGLFLLLISSFSHWLFRLPGDIRIEKGNFHFYFPITTSLLLSALLTLIFSLVALLKR